MAIINSIGQPVFLTALFKHILRSPELLEEIAARSYRHTNHFDKIVLVDTRHHLGYRLTLHLWEPPYSDAEINDEQIHDHRFSFWSKVLVGATTFQNYIRDATGIVYREYQYIPERLGEATVGNFYIDVGTSPLLEIERSGGHADDVYHLAFSQIHRVVIPTQLTCTLVLRGPRQKNYASVFSNTQKYDPSANAMFAPADLAARLNLLLQNLT